MCRRFVMIVVTLLSLANGAWAGQVPGGASDRDIPITHQDRVYSGDQFSNTVSVLDPATNTLLGVIRLGEPQPANLSPLYRGQVLVHGLGFSPDHKTLAVVSIGTNSVSFIDTATNVVKHVTYIGRAPHEAFFTPDGSELWVTVRGENYVQVIDPATFEPKTRIILSNGPGMTIFSPDGKYGYVCSSFTPELDVVSVAEHSVVGKVVQASPFCPNLAATPDGKQIWFTLKDVGKVEAFDAHPPFSVLATIDTGPITNHVNIVRNRNGQFAYVTVGGLDAVKVFRTDSFAQVATIAVGNLPHGIWPSADGSRIYVGLENADAVMAIDTLSNRVLATIPVGQAPQALVYVPEAVPTGEGKDNLQPLGIAGEAVHFELAPRSESKVRAPTTVALFEQGLTQVLQVAETGLEPKHSYFLALSRKPDGSGPFEVLANFTSNPAGGAIVTAVGPIRQIVQDGAGDERRFLAIGDTKTGTCVQAQTSGAHPGVN